MVWEAEVSQTVSLERERRCRSFPLARLTVSSSLDEEVYCGEFVLHVFMFGKRGREGAANVLQFS